MKKEQPKNKISRDTQSSMEILEDREKFLQKEEGARWIRKWEKNSINLED